MNIIVPLFIIVFIVMFYNYKLFNIKENMDFIIQNNIIDSKYTAVIIEPREHKALEYVLTNFLENLNSDWNIIVFHGNKNNKYVNDIINMKLEKYKNRIKMINLNIDNLEYPNGYNDLLYNKNFYDYIPSEIFLIFQTDTIICSKYKDFIYKYINYDYVGAPWMSNGLVGNGGLSLRRKSKMLALLDKCDINYNFNEDGFFSNMTVCNNVDINKPTFDEAKDFSIETVYNDKSFGIHKAYTYIDTDGIDKISKFCPEIIELKKLNDKENF
jgi:hypothetical protein